MRDVSYTISSSSQYALEVKKTFQELINKLPGIFYVGSSMIPLSSCRYAVCDDLGKQLSKTDIQGPTTWVLNPSECSSVQGRRLAVTPGRGFEGYLRAGILQYCHGLVSVYFGRGSTESDQGGKGEPKPQDEKAANVTIRHISSGNSWSEMDLDKRIRIFLEEIKRTGISVNEVLN